MLTKPRVTSNSTDEEIIDAINMMGEHRYPWRIHDWPEPGSNNIHAWVIPSDIGRSDTRDRSLIKRLHRMVRQGKLEVRYTRRARRFVYGYRAETTRTCNAMPRFRVVLK
jgi:hypothetical protein